MKTEIAIKNRLEAEYAACQRDPTLNKNDFVQGYIEALEFVLEEQKA